jgi:hypothetical protein
MKALKDALHDGFGIAPARVVQSSYEPIQYDETGALCGSLPTLGMDVHPGLNLSRARLHETADFLREFLARLECIAGSNGRSGCPAHLATGTGTGFQLVTDHIPEFTHREGSPLFDILQPAYAGLYSGAMHPTAEAHAIVADHVIRHVRTIVNQPSETPGMIQGSAQ